MILVHRSEFKGKKRLSVLKLKCVLKNSLYKIRVEIKFYENNETFINIIGRFSLKKEKDCTPLNPQLINSGILQFGCIKIPIVSQ